MIRLEPTSLIERLKNLQRTDDHWRTRLGAFSTIEVTYEDFVRQPDDSASKILDFLGVDDAVPLRSELQKLTPDSLDAVLLNIDEIRSMLTGTEFEWCLGSH